MVHVLRKTRARDGAVHVLRKLIARQIANRRLDPGFAGQKARGLRLRLATSHDISDSPLKIGALVRANFGRALKRTNASANSPAKNGARRSRAANAAKKITVGIGLPLNGKILPKLAAALFDTFGCGFGAANAEGTTNSALRYATSE